MAFLGHKDGPRVSEILKRKLNEVNLVKMRGSGPLEVPRSTLLNIIAAEEEEEKGGQMVEVLIPVGQGAKKGEFLYRRLDPETDSGIEFYYTLTEEERMLLGSDYKRREIKVMAKEEAMSYENWRREVMDGPEFAAPGLT